MMAKGYSSFPKLQIAKLQPYNWFQFGVMSRTSNLRCQCTICSYVKATYFASLCKSITCQAIELESSSQPSKDVAHLLECINTLTTARANILACSFLAINRQPLKLFKPSTDSASLLVDSEKKRFSCWVWRFLGGNVTSRSVFVLFWPSLPGPGCRPNGPLFGLKV